MIKLPAPLAEPALCGQDHLVPVALDLGLKRLAQDRFGSAESVSLRGVEEVDAKIQRLANRSLTVLCLNRTPLSSKDQVPKAILDTCRSVCPSCVYST